MSENLSRDFSKYEAMETEELEEILRLDSEAPVGAESDTELILFILEVLASRRNTKTITGNTAQKAWESFEQNYMPKEPQKSVEKKEPAYWIRKLTAAAAVVALLICIPISTKALTLEEVFEIIACWAKETFSFASSEDPTVSEPMPEDQRDYASLYEMLLVEECEFLLVPRWIPDGFALESIKKITTPAQETYSARYVDENRKFTIRVQNYLTADFQKVEVEEGYSEIYPVGEQNYYIFINYDQIQAVWIVDSYECTISGNLSVDEIKLLIDSIEKG